MVLEDSKCHFSVKTHKKAAWSYKVKQRAEIFSVLLEAIQERLRE